MFLQTGNGIWISLVRIKKVKVIPTLDDLIISFLTTSASSAGNSASSPGHALPLAIAGCPADERWGLHAREEGEIGQNLESDFERVL